MARDLMDDTYYTSKGGKIPVKWTAPEVSYSRRYHYNQPKVVLATVQLLMR